MFGAATCRAHQPSSAASELRWRLLALYSAAGELGMWQDRGWHRPRARSGLAAPAKLCVHAEQLLEAKYQSHASIV